MSRLHSEQLYTCRSCSRVKRGIDMLRPFYCLDCAENDRLERLKLTSPSPLEGIMYECELCTEEKDGSEMFDRSICLSCFEDLPTSVGDEGLGSISDEKRETEDDRDNFNRSCGSSEGQWGTEPTQGVR